MKTVFNISLLFCLLFGLVIEADAQSIRKKFTSDVHIGLNFAEMDVNSGQNDNNKLKLGVAIGVNFNYKIFHNIQLQTGFYISKKGLKQEMHRVEKSALLDEYIYDTIKTTTASYIQIPLAIGYEVYLSKNFAFNINGGVYGAYGFKGEYENKYFQTIKQYEGPVFSEPIEKVEGDTFDIDKWKRWDYGLIGSVGFIYDIFTINFNYEYGLQNVSSVSWENMKNRNMSVLLGIRF